MKGATNANGRVVTLDTAQTITGIKTFKADSITLEAPSGNTARSIIFSNTNTNLIASIEVNQYGSIDLKNGTNATTRAPNQRTYNASNTSDVVTIGSLQASTDVVHTTGNESITGLKEFAYAPRGLRYISTSSGYKEVFKIASTTTPSVNGILTGRVIDKGAYLFATFILTFRTNTATRPILKTSAPIEGFFCTVNADGSVSLWMSKQRIIVFADTFTIGNQVTERAITDGISLGTLNLNAKPVVGTDYYFVEDSILTDNLVDTLTEQTIAGEKKFSKPITVLSSDGMARCRCLNTSLIRGTLPSADTVSGGFSTLNNNQDTLMGLNHTIMTSGAGRSNWFVRDYANSNYKEVALFTGGYLIAPNRTYNASNTSDVVTIGSLQSSTDVVHTAGNEGIGGVKTFGNTPIINSHNIILKNTTYAKSLVTSVYTNLAEINLQDKNDGILTQIRNDHLQDDSRRTYILTERTISGTNYQNRVSMYINGTGSAYVTAPSRAYNASNTTDVVTIGTLDAYTPMVRTSGNQNISGVKTFTGYIVANNANYNNITIVNNTDDNTDNTKTDRHAYLIFADKNGVPIARIGYTHNLATRNMKLRFYKTDGTWFPDIVLGEVTE